MTAGPRVSPYPSVPPFPQSRPFPSFLPASPHPRFPATPPSPRSPPPPLLLPFLAVMIEAPRVASSKIGDVGRRTRSPNVGFRFVLAGVAAHNPTSVCGYPGHSEDRSPRMRCVRSRRRSGTTDPGRRGSRHRPRTADPCDAALVAARGPLTPGDAATVVGRRPLVPAVQPIPERDRPLGRNPVGHRIPVSEAVVGCSRATLPYLSGWRVVGPRLKGVCVTARGFWIRAAALSGLRG
jgi:hypothetical protein